MEASRVLRHSRITGNDCWESRDRVLVCIWEVKSHELVQLSTDTTCKKERRRQGKTPPVLTPRLNEPQLIGYSKFETQFVFSRY